MIAVDANLPVHAHQREAYLRHAAQTWIRTLAEFPVPWAICFQRFVEFYAVVTHSRLWKQPSTPKQALEQIRAWRESPSLRILTDSEASLDRMGELAMAAHVRGGQIHDARIAACCRHSACGICVRWTVTSAGTRT